jgi:hypothetical protein
MWQREIAASWRVPKVSLKLAPQRVAKFFRSNHSLIALIRQPRVL